MPWPEPVIKTLVFAQRYVAAIPWKDIKQARAVLTRTNAFVRPEQGDEEGIRLRIPDAADLEEVMSRENRSPGACSHYARRGWARSPARPGILSSVIVRQELISLTSKKIGRLVVSSNNTRNFLPNLLDWTVNRRDRTFHVYVVEPAQYEPKTHSNIFDAAINVFIERRPGRIDPYVPASLIDAPLRFDLVTFPEAFLPPQRLLEILKYIGLTEAFGCVHVGLRPSATEPNHLFQVEELRALIRELKQIPDLTRKDLEAFEGWLKCQDEHARFNVGCLFTLDADRQVRVCLHPKMVQSKYEISPLEEQNMEEGNLLTAVVLRPTNKNLKTIIVQPLLCSDALHLPTKRGGSRPLEAMQRDADCLGKKPPDHVDIVSVATCTPQVSEPSSKGSGYRIWHNEFRKTFERAATDDSLGRHHFATFVLSNFQLMPAGEPGGLLRRVHPGAREKQVPFLCYTVVSRLAQDSAENRWSRPDEDCITDARWERRTRGYIAALSPISKPEAIARMFGFAIHRLPRDQSLWSANEGLTYCTLRVAELRGESRRPNLRQHRYTCRNLAHCERSISRPIASRGRRSTISCPPTCCANCPVRSLTPSARASFA